jgi:zinc and cadmium transporter
LVRFYIKNWNHVFNGSLENYYPFFSRIWWRRFRILFKGSNHKQLKLVLSFSGAYLFAITVLHLIPDAYHGNDNYVGVFILIGFLFQIILEQFSDGIEHGHIHAHLHPGEKAIFPIGIMVSLCLHAFLEGMPLAEGQQNQLVFGIALHHIPAAFALGSVLLGNHIKKGSTVFYLFCLPLWHRPVIISVRC